MNKETREVYDWLIMKPGYLKCSAEKIIEKYPNSKKLGKSAIWTVLKALKEAKKVNKATNKPNLKLKRAAENFMQYLNSKKSKNIYGMDSNNVLVIPDTHFPFEKEGILEHCLAMQKKYNCGTVVHIGDEIDLAGVSQWEKDPDGFSPGTEATLAQEKMKTWYKAFPQCFVCIGNHTARPFRLAKSNGLPKKFLKSYEEAWEAPEGWKWADHWEFNGVLYTHGTGMSGDGAALKIAIMHRQNTVIGHIHSSAGVQYSASKIDLVWGLQVGGAIDGKSYAAHYAKDQLKKSIVGCGIVINGKLPIFEPMCL